MYGTLHMNCIQQYILRGNILYKPDTELFEYADWPLRISTYLLMPFVGIINHHQKVYHWFLLLWFVQPWLCKYTTTISIASNHFWKIAQKKAQILYLCHASQFLRRLYFRFKKFACIYININLRSSKDCGYIH